MIRRASLVLSTLVVVLLMFVALLGGCGGGGASGGAGAEAGGADRTGSVTVRLALAPRAALEVQASPSPSPSPGITHVILDVLDTESGTRVVSPVRVDVVQNQSTQVALRVSPGFRQIAADFRGENGSLGTDAENVEIVPGRSVSVDLSPGGPRPSPSPSPSPQPPAGNRIYIANRLANTVTVLDAVTLTPVAGSPFAVVSQPSGLSVDTVRNRLWVSGSADVSVLDTATMTNVAGSPIVLGGSFLVDALYVSTRDRTFITDLGNNRLRAFNAATLAPAGDVFSDRPAEMAFDVLQDLVWVADNLNSDDKAEIFDPASLNQVPGSPARTGGTFPDGAAYDPDRQRIYITNSGSNSLAVIDAVTKTAVPGSPFPTGSFPNAVAYDGTNDRIYVTDLNGNTLTVYDAVTLAPLPGSPFATGNQPFAVAYDPVRNRVYVANSADGTLKVFDAPTMTLISTIPVGNDPRDVILGP